MKKFLVAVITVAVVAFAVNVSAYVAEIKLSFDDQGNRWSTDLPSDMVLDTLTVWTSGMGMYLAAIDYKIEYDPVVTFIGDLMVGDALPIGSSPTGISIAFPSPGDAHVMFAVQRVVVMWNGTDCALYRDSPINIVPYPGKDRIEAVRWPDLWIVEAQGVTSYICPTGTPTQNATWGVVKTLYQ